MVNFAVARDTKVAAILGIKYASIRKSLTLAKLIHAYLHYDFIVIFCWFRSFVNKLKHCYLCSSLFSLYL